MSKTLWMSENSRGMTMLTILMLFQGYGLVVAIFDYRKGNSIRKA